jgi:hypothetical protein
MDLKDLSKLKIISDGTTSGTKIFDEETGFEIKNCDRLVIEMDAKTRLCNATLHLFHVPIEISNIESKFKPTKADIEMNGEKVCEVKPIDYETPSAEIENICVKWDGKSETCKLIFDALFYLGYGTELKGIYPIMNKYYIFVLNGNICINYTMPESFKEVTLDEYLLTAKQLSCK